jgi:hypothetical protein
VDLAHKGELIFNELVWRSFLQDVKPGMVLNSHGTPYETILCKMHDLMHDLAKDVADECVTIEELIQHKALSKDVRPMHIAQYGWHMSRSELEQNQWITQVNNISPHFVNTFYNAHRY